MEFYGFNESEDSKIRKLIAELRVPHIVDSCVPRIQGSECDKKQIEALTAIMKDRPNFTFGDFMAILLVDTPSRRAKVFSIYMKARNAAKAARERV